MPRLISHELPDDLYSRLNGREIEKYLNHAVLLYTVDGSGWPHPSLLSYFEVGAKDRKNLRLATYNTSNTTENMRRNGIVTLSIFDLRVAYAIKGRAQEMAADAFNPAKLHAERRCRTGSGRRGGSCSGTGRLYCRGNHLRQSGAWARAHMEERYS